MGGDEAHLNSLFYSSTAPKINTKCHVFLIRKESETPKLDLADSSFLFLFFFFPSSLSFMALFATAACGDPSPEQRDWILIGLYIDRERNDNGAYKNGVKNQVLRCMDNASANVEFISNAQIEAGCLQDNGMPEGKSCSVVYIPGGSVFSQESSLSDMSVVNLVAFVTHGGGVVGVCAGALLLGAEGYDGCRSQRCMLGATTTYMPGKGVAELRLTETYGRAVFGKHLDDATVLLSMPYSHGACFTPNHYKRNELADIALPACFPLAAFVSIRPEAHLDDALPQKDGDTEAVTGTSALPLPFRHSFPIVMSLIGKGRIIAIGPHPESIRACESSNALLKVAMRYAAFGSSHSRHGAK